MRAQSPPVNLFTHDFTARHDSNTIIKFADDTTVVGLITDNDETAYREKVRDLAVIKTKEMIVDYRKKRTENASILINWAVVEQVERFKFLGPHQQQTRLVQTHQDSREEGTTKSIPPQETKKICQGS